MAILLPQYKGFQQERIIGDHKILLPDPPDLKTIAYKDLPESDQFFKRTYLPNNWDLLPREDKNEFANNQWDIRGREGERGKGFWFWNNGNLEYMTPNHYFYTNWWNLGRGKIPTQYIIDKRDIHYPFFTDADRDWHYIADEWWYNPLCIGGFTIEMRRGGKTFRVGCFQYEKVSKHHNVSGGIQSRDDTDSYNVFIKIVYGWKNLPPFFKPVDIGNNNPVTELRFDEPRKMTTKSQKKEYTDVLASWIDYMNASEGAYDGKEQIINIQDEIGKISSKKGVNLNERIRVVTECCIVGKKVGMILATTTVEEMDKGGGKQAKELWLKSTTLDHEARLHPEVFAQSKALDDTGMTMSKLHRYFRPANYGLLEGLDGNVYVDKHGYSLKEEAKEYFMKRRKNKKGADLASEKRKFPLDIVDCWVSDVKKSTYDTDKVEQQLAHNQSIPTNILVRGNFMWNNGEKDTDVVWHPCDNGRWEILWMPELVNRNKSTIIRGKKMPSNTDIGCFGLDPYDNKTTVDNRKSDAASYGIRKFDPMNPYESGIFVTGYVNRPPLPETMWEDMILQCVFYGWEILIESNKIGTINHFRMRGYENYLMMRPEETQTESSKMMLEPGIPMSGPEPRQALIYATESYIVNNVGLIEREGELPRVGKCYFDKLLNNWLEFDFEQEWTKFDSMVGAGLALLGARKYIPKIKQRKTMNFFPEFKMQGGRR